jgi:hypothetical protein
MRVVLAARQAAGRRAAAEIYDEFVELPRATPAGKVKGKAWFKRARPVAHRGMARFQSLRLETLIGNRWISRSVARRIARKDRIGRSLSIYPSLTLAAF